MDERCDYVQKILAEWELQNKIFEILKSHRLKEIEEFLKRMKEG